MAKSTRKIAPPPKSPAKTSKTPPSAKSAKFAKPVKSAKAKKPAKPTPKPLKPASKTTPAKPPVKPSKKTSTKPVAAPAKAKPASKPAAAPAKAKPAEKPVVKSAAKPAPAPVAKAGPSKAPAKTPEKPAPAPAKPSKAQTLVVPLPLAGKTSPALKGKDAVRARILAQRAKPAKPASFSLDEVLAIARTAKATAEAAPVVPIAIIATKSGKTAPLPADALKPVAPTKVKAASLADILGFNPKARASHAENEEAAIPEKYKRYYKLLIELRNHVTGQVDQHSEETLKRSAKEDSGDLSSYGTDGGTDSFDRDFALSLVANEQEALSEIEAAIQRIKAGNYGVCEHTQQPIPKDRLVAVPFTRYTAAAMKEIEKTRYKVRGQSGILGEGEEGGPKMEDDGGGE